MLSSSGLACYVESSAAWVKVDLSHSDEESFKKFLDSADGPDHPHN